MSTRKLIEAILENKAVEADSLLKETMDNIVSEKLTEAKKIVALRFGIEDYADLNEVAEPTGDLKDTCWKGYTAVGLKKKDGKMVPNCVPKEEINEDSDSAARELHTYADKNTQLHKTSHVPVAKNLEKKFKKGTYDHEKAKTLWKYHADRAADAYAKEHGSGQKGHQMFSVADRKKAAERMANDHHAEMKAGNFHTEEINEETLDEANVQKMGRVKLIRARIRGGKVQRRKKVSAVKGFTLRSGKLTRMSPQERLKRKRGARRAKIKRRAKASRIRMKYQRALRKRKSLGLR
jgi:hypothetical protein